MSNRARSGSRTRDGLRDARAVKVETRFRALAERLITVEQFLDLSMEIDVDDGRAYITERHGTDSIVTRWADDGEIRTGVLGLDAVRKRFGGALAYDMGAA